MANPLPVENVVIDTSSLAPATSSSLWDRVSNWVSENKAVVYTVAGIAVVVTGGTVYYLSTTPSKPHEPAQPKKSKNQRRKEKKKAEEEKKAQEAKAAAEGETDYTSCIAHTDTHGMTEAEDEG